MILTRFKALFSLLVFIVTTSAYAQDGFNKASISGGASFRLEPVWSSQIDPRWKPGEIIGDVEDGITVEFVEFSADGKQLVTGNGEGYGFILSAVDGSVQQTFTYITEQEVRQLERERVSNISGGFTKSLEVECGAFTPDGKYVVIGGNLNGIKIIDLQDGSVFKHIQVDEEVDGLSISPDGRFLAYAAYRSVVVVSVDNWEEVQNVAYAPGSKGGSVVNSIHFTADGKCMVMAGNAGEVAMVRTRDWTTIGQGRIPYPSSIKSVRISPDERLVAAGNGGGEITVWRTWDMSLAWQFSSMVYIEAVAWSADGRYLFAGGRDDSEGRLMVFRTLDWQMVGNPSVLADGASIEYIDVHEDLIAVAGEDGHVRVFQVHTNRK